MDAGALLDLLGNENRRRILRLLARKPCYVTEISDHLGVSPKAVIDHLRRLEEAGIVESRTDDQRRKYFNIAENLRLEVTVAPYGFGMKSAYPASPTLDLSNCQHLSIEIRERAVRASAPALETASDAESVSGPEAPPDSRTDDAPAPGPTPDPDPDEVADLAAEIDELEDVARELSLAQRWVQGRITDVLDTLAEAIDDEGYLDAAILAAIAGGADDPEAIGREADVPTAVVRDRLDSLETRGLVRRRKAEEGGENDAHWYLP